MADAKPIVFVVDDDESVCASLKLLIESGGYRVVTCKSAEDFLDFGPWESPCCLILDIRLSE
jgi:FixJ family two-component response regulator